MKITKKQLRRIINKLTESHSERDSFIKAEFQEIDEVDESETDELEEVQATSIRSNLAADGSNAPDGTGEVTVTQGTKSPQGFGENIIRVTESKLRNIIKKSILSESYMKERYGQIEEIIYSVLEVTPGIGGMDLVEELQSIWAVEALNSDAPPVNRDEIFSILDIMQEEGEIFFNVEEDEWYLSEQSRI